MVDGRKPFFNVELIVFKLLSVLPNGSIARLFCVFDISFLLEAAIFVHPFSGWEVDTGDALGNDHYFFFFAFE